MNYGQNEDNIRDEMDELKTRKNKNFSSVVNKRKVTRFEMDDFFMGG